MESSEADRRQGGEAERGESVDVIGPAERRSQTSAQPAGETPGYGTLGEARAELRSLTDQTAALLRAAGDPSRPVRGSSWNVGEVAAHLVIALGGFTRSVGGDLGGIVDLVPPREGMRFDERLAGFNTRCLEILPERDPAILGDQLVHGVEAFLAASGSRPGGDRMATPWYGLDTTLTVERATCLLIGEQVMHGWDIARTVGASWPMEPTHARLVLNAAMAMMPRMVDRQRTSTVDVACDVRVRGGQRFVIRARRGTVSIEPSDGQRVTYHLSVDPVGFALVGYGRINQWSAIAKGQLMTWGRRPWEALRLKSLFVNP